MTYKGHIKNGVVVLDEQVNLPDGTQVRVEAVGTVHEDEPSSQPMLTEIFKDIIGKGEGLPSDGSEQHDHYIYGTPRR